MKKINVINRVMFSCYDNNGELKIINTGGKYEIAYVKLYENKQTYDVPQFLTVENYLSLISNLFVNAVRDIYNNSLTRDEARMTLFSNTQIFCHEVSYSKSHDAYINIVTLQLIEFENSRNKLDVLSIYNKLVNNNEFKDSLNEYSKEYFNLNLYQMDKELDESKEMNDSSNHLKQYRYDHIFVEPEFDIEVENIEVPPDYYTNNRKIIYINNPNKPTDDEQLR